eukprot:15329705-Ditylum_brightwellii.AAC.1
MLGVHKALNLQETDSLKHIHTKIIIFAKAINACPIPKSKVLQAFLTIYIPSVSYIFLATAFIDLELLQLHKILLPQLLPRAGYKYNVPHAVPLAPKKFLGAGFLHLKAVHLSLQVEMLLSHL